MLLLLLFFLLFFLFVHILIGGLLDQLIVLKLTYSFIYLNQKVLSVL